MGSVPARMRLPMPSTTVAPYFTIMGLYSSGLFTNAFSESISSCDTLAVTCSEFRSRLIGITAANSVSEQNTFFTHSQLCMVGSPPC